MRGLTCDAAAALTRAIRVNFVNFTGVARVESLEATPWASVTFSGARQTVAVELEGDGAEAAADRFLADLSEREFGLRGHILADIALRCDAGRDGGARVRLELEALTVEE